MTDSPTNHWRETWPGWVRMILAASLCLSVATWFLATKGQVNYFPTYTAAIAVLVLILTRQHATRGFRLYLPCLSLVGWFVLSSLWSPASDLSQVALTAGYGVLLLSFVIGIAIVGDSFPGFTMMLTQVCVAAAAASAVLSLGLFHSTGYSPLTETDRLYGLGRLGNPVVGALTWSTAMLLAAVCACNSRCPARFAWIGCAVVLLIAIADTLTRSVWPALFVTAIFAIGRDPELTPGTRFKAIGGIVATTTTLGLLVLFSSDLGEVILRRSTSFRPEIWRATLDQMSGIAWLRGNGINASGTLALAHTFVHSHSIYFATLHYGGLIGIALLIWTAFSALRFAPVNRLENLYQATLVFGLAVLMLDGDRLLEKFDHHWIVFWLPMAVVLATNISHLRSVPARRPEHPNNVNAQE